MNVTSFIKMFPQNDLIDSNKIKVLSFDQNHKSMYPVDNDGNINPMQLGVLVDYLTRLMLTHDVKASFDIPLKGLKILEEFDFLGEKETYINETKQAVNKIETKLSGGGIAGRHRLQDHLRYVSNRRIPNMDKRKNNIGRYLDVAANQYIIQIKVKED